MKFSNQSGHLARLSMIAILAGACGLLPASLLAAEPVWPQIEREFASPDDAIKALQAAVQAKD
jgi:hypothetical protein